MNKMLTTVFALAVASVTAFSSTVHAQEVKADVNAKVAMCIGCHGIDRYQATFPEVYKVPRIAGQGEKYIAAALTAYKKGDRKHPTMRGIADSLSEQDIAEISAYYAQLGRVEGATLPDKPSREPNAQVAALLNKGACVSCHGANFAKPIDPSYPKIAGQYSDYLYVALKSYQMSNSPVMGRNNAVMGGVAKQFSHAELNALASYVSTLDGDLKTVPESRFR